MRAQLTVGCAAAFIGLIGSVASAVPLIEFVAQPTSGAPELKFGSDSAYLFLGPRLQTGPGADSNGDGNLSPSQQAAPGLQVSTPLTITAPPNTGAVPNDSGGTTFYDVSFALGGLFAPQQTGPGGANSTSVGGITVLTQPLGAGSFVLRTTDPDGGGLGQPAVLLAGSISDAAIIGIQNGGTGSVLSATVIYTQGLIYDRLVAQGGSLTGDLSFTLLNIAAPLSIVNSASGNFLSPFEADATGQFSVAAVPEPAALGSLGFVASLLLRRRAARA